MDTQEAGLAGWVSRERRSCILEGMRPAEDRRSYVGELGNPDLASDFANDWVVISLSKSQGNSIDARGLAWAAEAAEAIERELNWYFQRRDARFWGWRRDTLGTSCSRTVFARQLRRYAASSLRSADREPLRAWCDYLRCIVTTSPFSSLNLVRSSEFERTLQACLVRLELLQRRLESLPQPRLPACTVACSEVAKAVKRWGGRSTALTLAVQPPRCEVTTAPHLRAAAVRLARAPLLSGVRTLLGFGALANGLLLGVACTELAGHLVGEGQAYAAGMMDELALAEEVVVSAGSMAGLALRGYVAPMLFGAGLATVPVCAAIVESAGAGAASIVLGFLIRKVARSLRGDQRTQALHRAYATLGLSPSGASTYSPADIEAQLEWAVRCRPRSAFDLWVAYSYIRECHHPSLRDPWTRGGKETHRGLELTVQ